MVEEAYDISSVLTAYFELSDLAGTSSEHWSERAFRHNPPRLYRYQRLQALLRAFDLPLDAVKLEGAGILRDRESSDYQFLYDELLAAYQRGELSTAPRHFGVSGYGMLYQQFFRLLREQYRLQRFNSGWLEAGSAEAQYAIQVAERFISSYDHAQLAAVRQTVHRLLDPAGRRFSRQELLQRFGFPDVDLLEVDLEWR